MENIIIRKGRKEDLSQVLDLIIELAIYEKAPDEVVVTVQDLERDAFGERPIIDLFVAEENNTIIGTAIYYYNYSTWKGKCIYLEDIVVSQKHRRRGIGTLLMDAMVDLFKKEKAKRLMWQVLDWNEPAIEFYKKYDAIIEPEWLNCKLVDSQF
ncbi:MAG: GNAT family N-acetyltransferase [Flavobacteriales bacterium]|nr:GNAT family N-acetyltransferase [Flavobacteriales bacterium]